VWTMPRPTRKKGRGKIEERGKLSFFHGGWWRWGTIAQEGKKKKERIREKREKKKRWLHGFAFYSFTWGRKGRTERKKGRWTKSTHI